MPADRRIRINIMEIGDTDQHGEYIEGPTTSYDVWALVEDQGSTDEQAEGGFTIHSRKAFTVRWQYAIARGNPGLMEVIEEYGHRFNVEEVQENSGRRNRRRFIEIVGLQVS